MTMTRAPLVTFGAGLLERRAELRDSAAEATGDARILALWRGKVLAQHMRKGSGMRLAFRGISSELFKSRSEPPLFLGTDPGGQMLMACDVSDWVPEAPAEELDSFLDKTVQIPQGEGEAGFHELRAIMTGLSPLEAEIAATARAMIGWHQSHRFCANCGTESRPANAGWQRDCPGCSRSHFPRTDPVVIMLVTHGDSVLLGRSPQWPEGMYSLLAGFVEPGETIEAAARREALEEVGVQIGAVRYLASQPWPFPNSLMFGCLAEAVSLDIHCDPTEIEDAIWVSRSRLLEIFAGTDKTIQPAREGAIAHFLLQHWLADQLA